LPGIVIADIYRRAANTRYIEGAYTQVFSFSSLPY
jgi:hypothetical protein